MQSVTVTFNAKLGTPEMGAFFQWPDLDVFHKLHEDPRFLSIKGVRDDALSFFSNGHFFCIEDDAEITFKEGQEYALVVGRGKGKDDSFNDLNPLVSLSSISNVSDDAYKPSQIHITDWGEKNEQSLIHGKSGKESKCEIFKFVMNLPA